MELKGKIIQELELVTGMGKKGEQWQKQEYILETQGQFPKKVSFSVWGDNIDKLNISLGDEVTVSIELESREFNGRWYTEVRGWKCEHQKFGGKPQASAPKSHSPQQSQEVDRSGPKDDDSTSDLPF